MKRSLYILSLLALLAPNVCAADCSYANQANIASTECASATGSISNGGAMASTSEVPDISLQNYEHISFTKNTAANDYNGAHTASKVNNVYVNCDLACGGAIYATGAVTLSANSGNITFEENIARAYVTAEIRHRVRGGAIKGDTVKITDNTGSVGSAISFTDNKLVNLYSPGKGHTFGGAIYAESAIDISGNTNYSVGFSKNSAGCGGAIASTKNSTIDIKNNGDISFTSNSATSSGGAVYLGATNLTATSSSDTGYVTLTISGNKSVLFKSNTATTKGGAIHSNKYSTVDISGNNGAVSFEMNSATALTGGLMGGAIRGEQGTKVSLNDNSGGVSFSGNYLTRSDTSPLYGGAISVDSSGVLNINGNANVVISGNYAYGSGGGVATGGAIAMYGSEFNLNNTKGDVQICNNYAGTQNPSASSGKTVCGGAIYGSKSTTINIQSNIGDVLVSGNKAYVYGTYQKNTAKGGAIYAENILNIKGNEKSVKFRSNIQADDTSGTILRSIYINSTTTTGALNLSAAAGGDITFYDSVYAAPSSTSYSLTADFNKESGNTGKIVFSGLHAAEDLAAVKADYSADELAASQTSTIQTLVTLHQGTLSIEEAACLQTKGMTANVGSNVQLVNGKLQMLDSGALTLNGTLSATGSNTIEGSTITYGDGGKFSLTLTADNKEKALLNLSGVSALSYGTAEVAFLGVAGLAEGEYKLLDLSASETLAQAEWLTEGITYTGLTQNDSFKWDDSGTVLYLVHTPEPTTATLSLLALAGLAARRRRK